MTERIDHAAKAERLVRLTDGYLERNALQAQVHATLALVEQQRIANLIALHRHEVKYDIGDWSRLYVNGTEDLKPDLAKGLGLS